MKRREFIALASLRIRFAAFSAVGNAPDWISQPWVA